MRYGLIGCVALLGLAGCYPVQMLQYDRPDVGKVLAHVRAGEAEKASLADGPTLDLQHAVTAGPLICSAALDPACFPAAAVVRLETREARDAPLWTYALAVPLAPFVLVDAAAEGLDRAVNGEAQTFSPAWAADALPEYNPCIGHVRRAAGAGWPSDQRIRADLYRRRAELGGACLVRLGAEPAVPVAARRRLHLTGLVRQRFEAFACARPNPQAEAQGPRSFVPSGVQHTGGREVDWPGELSRILRDPRTFAVTTDLVEGCAVAGGAAADLSVATERAREGWPLPHPAS